MDLSGEIYVSQDTPYHLRVDDVGVSKLPYRGICALIAAEWRTMAWSFSDDSSRRHTEPIRADGSLA